MTVAIELLVVTGVLILVFQCMGNNIPMFVVAVVFLVMGVNFLRAVRNLDTRE